MLQGWSLWEAQKQHPSPWGMASAIASLWASLSPAVQQPWTPRHWSLSTLFSPLLLDRWKTQRWAHSRSSYIGRNSFPSLLSPPQHPPVTCIDSLFCSSLKIDCLQTSVTRSQLPIWQKSKAAFWHRYRYGWLFHLPEVLSDPASPVTSDNLSLPG